MLKNVPFKLECFHYVRLCSWCVPIKLMQQVNQLIHGNIAHVSSSTCTILSVIN